MANTTCQYSYFESRWHKRFMDKAGESESCDLQPNLWHRTAFCLRVATPAKSKARFPGENRARYPLTCQGFSGCPGKCAKCRWWPQASRRTCRGNWPIHVPVGATILIGTAEAKTRTRPAPRGLPLPTPLTAAGPERSAAGCLQSIAPRYQLAPGSGHVSARQSLRRSRHHGWHSLPR